MIRRLAGLIKKEFIHCYRDPIAMSLVVYHFTLCVVLCAYSFVTDVKHLNMVVYDMNRTATSRELAEKFLSTEYFAFQSYATSMEEVKQKLDGGLARIALIIPPEFSRNLASGMPALLHFFADGSDANQVGQGVGFAKRIIAAYNENIILNRLKARGLVVKNLPGIDNQLRSLFNQGLDGVYYVIVYHLVFAGLIVGLVLSSTALVREKERGTIDQLMVTPTRSFEILAAKTISTIVICLIANVFYFLVIWWFDVPFRGNPFILFIFMAFYLIGITGIGIFIGTICKNMLQAILMSFLVWFAGALLAGMITPKENLLPFLQNISQVIPPTHFNIVVVGIFLKGLGFAELWPEAVKLLSTGFVLMMVGCFFAWRQIRQ